MPVIHMETEQVRAVADTMSVVAARMNDLHEFLNVQLQQLESAWQGEWATYFCDEAHFLSQQLDRCINDLDILAKRVHAEVTEWETVDGVASTAASSSVRTRAAGQFSPSLAGWAGQPNNNVGAEADAAFWRQSAKSISEFSEYLDKKIVTLGGFFTALTTRWINGELSFSGKKFFREMAGVPEYLWKTTKSGFAKFSIDKSILDVSRLGTLFVAMDCLGQWFTSWADYQRTSERVAATLVDTAFVGTKVVAVAAGQTLAMNLLGGVTVGFAATMGAPAVVVTGAGVALWWTSGYFINKAISWGYDKFKSSGWKDKIVRPAGDLIESGVKTAKRVVTSGIQTAKQVVTSGIQTARQVVTSGIQTANDFLDWNLSVARKATQMVDSGFRRVIGNIASAFD